MNLEKSNIKYQYEGMTFYFSKNKNLEKFKKLVNNYCNNEKHKFYKKYKILCNFNVYFSLSLYRRIEKSGFYVIGYDGLNIEDKTVIISDY